MESWWTTVTMDILRHCILRPFSCGDTKDMSILYISKTPGLLVTPVSIWHDPFTSTFEVRLAYIWDMHLRLEWYASNIVYLCIYKCDDIYIYIYIHIYIYTYIYIYIIYIYYIIYIILYICNHSIPSPKWVNDHPTAPPTSGRLADQLRTLRRRLSCRDMAIVGLFNIYST